MKSLSKILLTGVAAATLSFAHPASADLVTNGGFETGDFTGWTVGGTGTGTALVDGANPHSGSFAASFSNLVTLNDTISISQTINTIPGATYDLSLWLAHFAIDRGSGNSFQFFFGGNQIDAGTLISASGYSESTYTGLVASGSLTEIEFVFGGVSDGEGTGTVFLDDVSVSGPSVSTPEPFSTFWLALPFAGMVAFRRFRT